jgi:hypothetical protein
VELLQLALKNLCSIHNLDALRDCVNFLNKPVPAAVEREIATYAKKLINDYMTSSQQRSRYLFFQPTLESSRNQLINFDWYKSH